MHIVTASRRSWLFASSRARAPGGTAGLATALAGDSVPYGPDPARPESRRVWNIDADLCRSVPSIRSACEVPVDPTRELLAPADGQAEGGGHGRPEVDHVRLGVGLLFGVLRHLDLLMWGMVRLRLRSASLVLRFRTESGCHRKTYNFEAAEIFSRR